MIKQLDIGLGAQPSRIILQQAVEQIVYNGSTREVAITQRDGSLDRVQFADTQSPRCAFGHHFSRRQDSTHQPVDGISHQNAEVDS